MAKGFPHAITPQCLDECTETLNDVLEEIRRLQRWTDDRVGMIHSPSGEFLHHDDVIGVFALYLGDLSEGN
jgi:hypothetical protein